MTTGIIVTHGDLANEFLNTAKTVFGEITDVRTVTNQQKSPQVLIQEIESIVESFDSGQKLLVFIDFWGGSCCHACLDVKQRHDNIILITGVNLPMFLAFLYKRDTMPFDGLVDELIERGRSSVRVLDFESL
jgi:mannose/fructose-specific phosphotransferase system component IIA